MTSLAYALPDQPENRGRVVIQAPFSAEVHFFLSAQTYSINSIFYRFSSFGAEPDPKEFLLVPRIALVHPLT